MNRNLAILLSFSFVLRLAIIFTVGDIGFFGDEWEYNTLAVSLATGEGFKHHEYGELVETSYRAPLHPAMLAGVYAVFGENHTAARVAQSFWLIAAGWVFFHMGKLLFDERTGLLTAGLVVFDPLLIAFGTWLWAEPLYIFLAGTAFYCLLRFNREENKRWLIPAGLLWGLSTLTRESGQLLALLIICWLVWRSGIGDWGLGIRGWLKHVMHHAPRTTHHVLLFSLFTIGVVLPWTIRNYRLHNAFVPVTTVTGLAMWLGNNPYDSWAEVYGLYFQADTEAERERVAMKEAREYILASQPLWLPKKVLTNWPKLLGSENFLLRHLREGMYGEISSGTYTLMQGITTLFYGVVGSGGIVGIWLGLREKGRWIPGRVLILLPIIALLIGQTLLHAHSRHRIVILPYLALFAAWAWTNRRAVGTKLFRGKLAIALWLNLAGFWILLSPIQGRLASWLRTLLN